MSPIVSHGAQAAALVAQGALFVVNHSGGKDSQAMLEMVRQVVPEEQILIVHAHLAEVEWAGTEDHARRYAGSIPFLVAQATKTFIEMVERRFESRPDAPSWPSPEYRQCTSDLKRDPINREVRRYLKAHPEFGGLVVHCIGLRAQESAKRAKATTWKVNKRESVAGRQVFEWLPIHHLSEAEVRQVVADAGQELHWAYAKGMSRLSCVFCIMANEADLTIAAQENPDLYRRYVHLERRTGYTMSMSGRSLEEVTGIPVA